VSPDERDTPTREALHPASPDRKSGVWTYFSGQYRVERKLGTGGMGSVLLARDEHLDRWVAIKVLLGELADRPGVADRFRAEARAMARIRHPHVVGVHSFGEERGLPYLVMEHVPGEALHRALARRGAPPLRLDATIAIVDQICRGASAIHAAGLVHRDLKPGNVLVGPAGRVAISDFGLAAAIRDGAADQSWATPGYSAPELVPGNVIPKELRPRADVFSIGVITYELLTGRLPYPTEGDLAPDASLAVVPPSELVRSLPAAIDAAILSAIEIRPERRTRSVDAFRRALLDAAEAAPRRELALWILLADDDADYRDLSSRALRHAFPSARIDVFSDGASALIAARSARPGLVVTDLDMPGLDGEALIGELHKHPTTRGVPVLVASACGSSNDWTLLCRIGADAFVGKPFEMQQLAIASRGLIDAI
jgi:serine/threonine-protein kinase